MKKLFFNSLPSIVATLLLAGAMVYAAWTGPSQLPPNQNTDPPLNVSNIEQVKEGGLLLNNGGAVNGLLVRFGKVGIGTTDPAYKLDVNGDIKANSLINIGASALPGCSLTNRGQQFLFQGGGGVEDGFYICKKKTDGSYGWIALASPQLITIWENREYLAFNSSPAYDSFSVPSDAKYITCSSYALSTWLESSAVCYYNTNFIYQGSSFPAYCGSASRSADGGGLLEVSMLGSGDQYENRSGVNHKISCYYVK